MRKPIPSSASGLSAAWLPVLAILGMDLAAQPKTPGPGLDSAYLQSPNPAKSDRPSRLREFPLDSLRNGLVLVAGERLSNRWSAGSPSVRMEIFFQGKDSVWRMMKKGEPQVVKNGKKDWRLPTDVVGPVKLRIDDAATAKTLSILDVAILPPAGSPATGPFLETPLEKIRPTTDSSVKNIPFRTAKQFADAEFRLASASGGQACLPDYGRLKEFVLEDRKSVPSGNGVPILPARVKYHYWDFRVKQIVAGEFRGVGFVSERLNSNRATFLLKHEYHFSNFQDTIAKVEVRIGKDTLSLSPGESRGYAFAAKGRYTVILRAVTTRGESWDQVAILDVPQPPSPEVEARRVEMEKLSGLPVESGRLDVAIRPSEEIDSLMRMQNQQP